ncbi:MAG TPA: hypothetical protein VFX97_16830 [Pyrinomonadaceae bacterium]|nr:hypothetical protein [Pyrinomonadaceae bacterium]
MANIIPYGFRDMRDLADTAVTEALVPRIDKAIVDTVEFHNEEMDRVMDFFVKRTTDYKVKYRTPTSARLMGLDEHGRARKIRPGAEYEIGLPIQAAGLAEGATDTTRLLETVQDVMDITATMTLADKNWMLDHVLAALFNATTWTFPDDRYGDLVVQPIANGDTVTYLKKNGAAATADHVNGQAAAIADATNPFPGIYSRLTRPAANSGEVVSFVAENLVTSIEGLGNFIEYSDPDVRQPANTEELIGRLPDTMPGMVLGKVDKVWVVQWDRLPDSYVLSTVTGGERPLAMREYPVAALKGFRRAGQRNDYPYFETQFKRDAGFGAWNRVAADVLEIGDASYDVPTGYESPMQ